MAGFSLHCSTRLRRDGLNLMPGTIFDFFLITDPGLGLPVILPQHKMKSGFGLCCALQALCDKYFVAL